MFLHLRGLLSTLVVGSRRRNRSSTVIPEDRTTHKPLRLRTPFPSFAIAHCRCFPDLVPWMSLPTLLGPNTRSLLVVLPVEVLIEVLCQPNNWGRSPIIGDIIGDAPPVLSDERSEKLELRHPSFQRKCPLTVDGRRRLVHVSRDQVHLYSKGEGHLVRVGVTFRRCLSYIYLPVPTQDYCEINIFVRVTHI